jgi:hypothetical protein
MGLLNWAASDVAACNLLAPTVGRTVLDAIKSDSGLSGLDVEGELKLGFLEWETPAMTEVWR